LLKWNKYSIRRQLISVFIIVHVIFLLFLIFYYNYSLRQSYLGQVEDSLYHQALLIRENISADNFQFSNIDQWAREVGGKIEKRITIINRDGQVIADSVFSVEEMDNHLGRPEIQAVLTGERSGKDIRQSGTLNIDMYYLVVPVNNESFSGFIRLAESLEDIDAVLNTNIKNNISFFIIILILYLFLIWKITSNIINPLSQITDQVRKMANGNLQEEIRLRANANEIDTLARAFNFMAQQLKTKIEQVSAERNRAEAILTNMVDGLLVTDKNLMIKLVNPAARKMFSLQDKEFLGKSIIEVFRYHEIEDNFMKAMEENKLFTAELQIPGEPNKILKSNFVAINNERGQVIGALAVLALIIYYVFSQGMAVINWEFLTGMPRMGMSEGGILPAILGTFYLVVGAVFFAAPLGVLAAIYLTEYAKQGKLVKIIRIGVNNLAGVPSVVFGLFGLAIFVKLFGFGVSILSGSATLAIVILPTIIRAAEEALLAVPAEYRSASLALGATRWQTIKKVTLPAAMPGILTGIILGIGRVAGETASIMFTAATFFTMRLPSSIFSEVMALPYHIYALVTTGTMPHKQVPLAFGTAVVLLALVLMINLFAIVLRIRFDKKVKR